MSVLQPTDLAAALTGSSQLTQLCLTGMEAPLERYWREAAPPDSLKELSLRDCSGVTDSTLASLPAVAPQLMELTIGGEKREQYRLLVYVLWQ